MIEMYIGLHVKYPLLLSYFNETRIFPTNFRNIIKFHENPSSDSRFVPCRPKDRRRDMTNLIVAFRNIINALKYETHF